MLSRQTKAHGPHRGLGQRLLGFAVSDVEGILGQAAPGATSDTLLYRMQSNETIRCYCIVTERGGASAAFRIWLRKNGEATDNKQYIAYDTNIDANDSLSSVKFSISKDDEVYVRASTADVSFNLTSD